MKYDLHYAPIIQQLSIYIFFHGLTINYSEFTSSFENFIAIHPPNTKHINGWTIWFSVFFFLVIQKKYEIDKKKQAKNTIQLVFGLPFSLLLKRACQFVGVYMFIRTFVFVCPHVFDDVKFKKLLRKQHNNNTRIKKTYTHALTQALTHTHTQTHNFTVLFKPINLWPCSFFIVVVDMNAVSHPQNRIVFHCPMKEKKRATVLS